MLGITIRVTNCRVTCCNLFVVFGEFNVFWVEHPGLMREEEKSV